MKNKIKYSLYGLAAVFLIMQIVPVNRNNPQFDKETEIKAPVEIKEILVNSCYDCHSNQTNWPFYSYIAPVSWLVVYDVVKGREEINFSKWRNLPVQKKEKIKEEMIEEIFEDKMPLPVYLLTHSNARLNDRQKEQLKIWADHKE